MLTKQHVTYIDRFIVILMSLLVYLPGTNTGNYVRLGVLLFSFLLVVIRNGVSITSTSGKIAVCMAVSPIIPTIFVLIFERSLNTSLLAHEFIRMMYCAVLVLTVTKLRVDMKTIYFSTVLVLIPNFVIQLLQYYKVEAVFDFIKQHYIENTDSWTHLELARGTGANFRSGSIFLNPNVYVTIPLIALCVFFYRDRTKPNILNTILIVCTVMSGFLTGSRTSVVVMIAIVVIYMFKYSNYKRNIFWTAVLLFFTIRYGSFLMNNSRATQLDSTGSLMVKFKAFLWYWQRTISIPLYWLTGSLGTLLHGTMDAEWGYIYSWYGLFGLWWYIKYYKMIWNNNQDIKFFAKVVTVVFALVSITASVLLCMPVYSFAGTVALAQIVDKDRT